MSAPYCHYFVLTLTYSIMTMQYLCEWLILVRTGLTCDISTTNRSCRIRTHDSWIVKLGSYSLHHRCGLILGIKVEHILVETCWIVLYYTFCVVNNFGRKTKQSTSFYAIEKNEQFTVNFIHNLVGILSNILNYHYSQFLANTWLMCFI